MVNFNKIITVGLSPSWDLRVFVNGIDWNQHKVIDTVELYPAGKALNISKALAWMNQTSTAAGLWGKSDYPQMLDALSAFKKINVGFTSVPGRTRQNITLLDTANHREIHLRAVSELATKPSLKKLHTDLQKIISKDSVCVFAGAMPVKTLILAVSEIIDSCKSRSCKIAIDTSGSALKSIVHNGGLWLIKPNVEELSQLAGINLKDNTAQLLKAARPLLDKAEIILISRGQNGALAITKDGAWQANFAGPKRKVLSTVGCGDYFLAGFLKGFNDSSDIAIALETAIKSATAKAWGIFEKSSWLQIQKQIKVFIKKYTGV